MVTKRSSRKLALLFDFRFIGNTEIEASYLNILKIYQTLERHLERFPADGDRFPNFTTAKKPILSRGSAGPLEGETHRDYFHGRDGLGDVGDRHPELTLASGMDLDLHPYLEISQRSGVDVAFDIIKEHPPRSVTYIVLGPLTNLALLMRKDSQLVTDRIGRIVCMGGALDVPGNTTPVAEFNFFADPYAVKELLVSTHLHKGLPRDRFMMLPLDITTPHELPFPEYQKVVDPTFSSTAPAQGHSKSPVTQFTSAFLEKTREMMLQFGKDAMELHDIVAVWCAIENPSDATKPGKGWQGQSRVFDVERTGEVTRGMLVTDRREDESAYPLGTNRSEAQKGPHDDGHQVESIGYSISKKDDLWDLDAEGPGVFCITQTPGPSVLLQLLLQRVWGASPDR